MNRATRKGVIEPGAQWVDVQSEAMMWHDRARCDWVGHSVKLGEVYYVVDRTEDRGDGVWRLYLIDHKADQD